MHIKGLIKTLPSECLKVLMGISLMLVLSVGSTLSVNANGFPSETPNNQTDVSSTPDIHVIEDVQAPPQLIGQNNNSNNGLINQITQTTPNNNNTGTGGVLGEIAGDLQIERTISDTMQQPWIQALTNVVSTLISITVVIITLWIMFGTALDIMFIMVPPVRNLLSPGQESRGGGGMGMPGGMGGPQQGGGSSRIQFISMEARQLVQEAEGGGSSGGGMGMPGGGFGGPPMGGGSQQSNTPKNPLKKYIVLRAKAMIVLMIAIIMLLFNTFLFDIGNQLAHILIYLFVTIFDILLTIF